MVRKLESQWVVDWRTGVLTTRRGPEGETRDITVSLGFASGKNLRGDEPERDQGRAHTRREGDVTSRPNGKWRRKRTTR